LHDVADAAVSGASLSLTNLALCTTRPTSLRHRVKCVDRLRRKGVRSSKEAFS